MPAGGKRCRRAGVRLSTGSVGDAYDDAMGKRFFGSMECQLIDRHSCRKRRDAKLRLFHYIKGWYNPHRRHSNIGYDSPVCL